MTLKLKARNDAKVLITQELVGPKYEVRVEDPTTHEVVGVIGTYYQAVQAICKHFQLAARFGLVPSRD